MASEPYTDEELAAWLAVYPPVISSLDARWRPTIERLLRERDTAVADARTLADAAVKFNECGPALLDAVLQTAHDHLVEKFDTAALEVIAERRRTPPSPVIWRDPEVPND